MVLCSPAPFGVLRMHFWSRPLSCLCSERDAALSVMEWSLLHPVEDASENGPSTLASWKLGPGWAKGPHFKAFLRDAQARLKLENQSSRKKKAKATQRSPSEDCYLPPHMAKLPFSFLQGKLKPGMVVPASGTRSQLWSTGQGQSRQT